MVVKDQLKELCQQCRRVVVAVIVVLVVVGVGGGGIPFHLSIFYRTMDKLDEGTNDIGSKWCRHTFPSSNPQDYFPCTRGSFSTSIDDGKKQGMHLKYWQIFVDVSPEQVLAGFTQVLQCMILAEEDITTFDPQKVHVISIPPWLTNIRIPSDWRGVSDLRSGDFNISQPHVGPTNHRFSRRNPRKRLVERVRI